MFPAWAHPAEAVEASVTGLPAAVAVLSAAVTRSPAVAAETPRSLATNRLIPVERFRSRVRILRQSK